MKLIVFLRNSAEMKQNSASVNMHNFVQDTGAKSNFSVTKFTSDFKYDLKIYRK